MTIHYTSLCRATLFLIAQLVCASSYALESIEIALGDLQGDGWLARSVTLQIQLLPGTEHAGAITLESITLPKPIGRVDDVRIQCDQLTHSEAGTACTGRLKIAHLLGEPISGRVMVQHDSASNQVQLKLNDVGLAGGVWQIKGRSQAQGWNLDLAAQQVSGESLVGLLRRLGYVVEQQVSAQLNLTATLQGAADGVDAVRFQVLGEQLNYANSVGTQASENLNLELRGQVQRKAATWHAEVDAVFGAGALFIDPMYFEFAKASPAHLNVKGDWNAGTQQLHLQSMSLEHAGVARAQGELLMNLAQPNPLQRVTVEILDAQLPTAFDTYIQPWIRGQLGDALKTAGRFTGRYSYQAGADSAVHVALDKVDIDDPQQRFGFENLSGVIDWSSDATPRVSELGWQSGSLYRLALGPTQLAVKSQGTDFELREPVMVPLLDGKLMIDDLALSNPGEEDMRWRFDGVLTPVSMEAVCEALGWPAFGGQLSGMIPAVRYADKRLEIGGVLLVKAFDGALTVRNLRLEEPFGRVPRLNADLELDNLDLEALTKTFSFGKIQGRLGGYVKQLQMQAWQPVAFDARFATPEDDDSRHRISQKAVDNLSSIGGGVGGALSRSFLGVFEEFPYDRLGLSCRLKNGVCAMGGVAPVANGYYIVKGRFLPPRIDVVGYADQVDWHTLIDRLKSVTLEQGPVIK